MTNDTAVRTAIRPEEDADEGLRALIHGKTLTQTLRRSEGFTYALVYIWVLIISNVNPIGNVNIINMMMNMRKKSLSNVT